MHKAAVEEKIVEHKVIGLLRWDDFEESKKASIAALEAGLKIFEVTMSVPQCPQLISELKKKFPNTLIGAGTILTRQDAEKCVDAGADFFVSPHFDPQINYFLQNELYIPGAMTPTEMMMCHTSGRGMVKAFPAPMVTPAAIKAILGPLPFLKIVVTGGVNADTYKSYLDAGAVAFGLGGDLFSTSDLQKRNYTSIAEKTGRWMQLIEQYGN